MGVDLVERPARRCGMPYDELEARHFCAWARREAVLGLTPEEHRDVDFLDARILAQERLCDRLEERYKATTAAEMRTLEALVAHEGRTSPSKPDEARWELLEDWWRDIHRQSRRLEVLALQLLPPLLSILDLAEVRAASVLGGWNAMRRLLGVIEEATGLAARNGTSHREVRRLECLHRQVKGLVANAQEEPLTTVFTDDTCWPVSGSSTEVRTLDGLGMWACSRLDEVYEITTRVTHLVADEQPCWEDGFSGNRVRLSELDRLVANGFTQLKLAVRPPRSGYIGSSASPSTVERAERWSA